MKTVWIVKCKDKKQKLQRLLSITIHHFFQKECIAIVTESPRVSTYLDEMLWKYPQDFFLPHQKEWGKGISIIDHVPESTSSVIFLNLSLSPLSRIDHGVIYEFEEENHRVSKEKIQFYQKNDWTLATYQE